MKRFSIFCVIAALTFAMGCRGSDSSAGHADTGAPAATAKADATTSEDGAGIELTDARVAALERGLRKEADAVRAAQERSRRATTPQARGAAIQDTFESATMAHGAAAAGIPLDEYRRVRTLVNETLRILDYQGKIDGPLSMDLSRVDAESKARLSRDPLAVLPAASAEALRKRMGTLVPAWLDYVRLTAVSG